MNGLKKEFKCDLCDNDATHFARDLFDITKPTEIIVNYKAASSFKAGCTLHPVESNVIDVRPRF